MPTRTVVFTEIYKFNDEKKEILSSSEYLQMCGRAGRRGIDTIGNVYILLGERTQDSEADRFCHRRHQQGCRDKRKGNHGDLTR